MNERKPASDPEQLMDAPIPGTDRKKLAALGAAMDDILNGKGTLPADRKTGFCLMTFDLPSAERIALLSNVPHEIAVMVLRAQLAHYEAVAGGKMAGSENGDERKH